MLEGGLNVITEIKTEKDLYKAIERSVDNSTLFCRVRNAMSELLAIAEKAKDAELLNIYEQADLIKYQTILEELDTNYECFYDILENRKDNMR